MAEEVCTFWFREQVEAAAFQAAWFTVRFDNRDPVAGLAVAAVDPRGLQVTFDSGLIGLNPVWRLAEAPPGVAVPQSGPVPMG